MFVVFVFKQKTAYEMRISDWSSDVCSSDLARKRRTAAGTGARAPAARRARLLGKPAFSAGWKAQAGHSGRDERHASLHRRRCRIPPGQPAIACSTNPVMYAQYVPNRSEEHTSELQSLMRISYAVFCLKKKNKTN